MSPGGEPKNQGGRSLQGGEAPNIGYKYRINISSPYAPWWRTQEPTSGKSHLIMDTNTKLAYTLLITLSGKRQNQTGREVT